MNEFKFHATLDGLDMIVHTPGLGWMGFWIGLGVAIAGVF